MEKLPVELWAMIFAPLPANQVARLCRVASIWNRRLSADDVWQRRVQRLFGRQHEAVPPGKWKACYGRLYLEALRRRDPKEAAGSPPMRFVLFAGVSTIFLVVVASLLVPFSLYNLIASPAPAVAVWIVVRIVATTRSSIKLNTRFTRNFARFRVYSVAVAIALELGQHRLGLGTTELSLLYSYIMNCVGTLFWGILYPNRPQPELRLLHMIASWYLCSEGSLAYLLTQLVTPLAVHLRFRHVMWAAPAVCAAAKLVGWPLAIPGAQDAQGVLCSVCCVVGVRVYVLCVREKNSNTQR